MKRNKPYCNIMSYKRACVIFSFPLASFTRSLEQRGGFLLATARSTLGLFQSGIKTLRNDAVCWQEKAMTLCVFCEHLPSFL